jgi:transposase
MTMETETHLAPLLERFEEIFTRKIYRVSDIAAMFGRSPRTVRRWVEKSEVPVTRVCGTPYLCREEVRAMLLYLVRGE